MLSGILEEDEGWFVAQLTTNQNETIGCSFFPKTLFEHPFEARFASAMGLGAMRSCPTSAARRVSAP